MKSFSVIKVLSCVFCMSFLASPLFATPSQVVLIRHGEKTSDENNPHLSRKGYTRASALVEFLTSPPQDFPLNTPISFIFAQGYENHPSMRPVETVTPISESLEIPIATHEREDFKKMCETILTEAKYDGKAILICWSHDSMSSIAKRLGVKNVANWPGKRYDRVGLITYSSDGSASFEDHPQYLLPGDSEN